MEVPVVGMFGSERSAYLPKRLNTKRNARCSRTSEAGRVGIKTLELELAA